MVVKWEIYDPVGATTTVFDVNPAEGGSPNLAKNVSQMERSNTGVVTWEGSKPAVEYSVSGTLLSQSQYDFFVTIWNVQHQVKLTDDLGREFWIYIKNLNLSRLRKANHPWAHRYQMDYVEMDVV